MIVPYHMKIRIYPIFAAVALLFSACVSTQPDSRTKGETQADPRSRAYTFGGFPAGGDALLLLNRGYAVGYSEDLLNPLWAAYYCGPDKLYENGKRPGTFSSDARLDSALRLTHRDYNRPLGLGFTYDRGHMAPNYAIATRYGREAQLETFLLTNICPQRSSLNQQTWRALEALIANVYAPRFDGVWVIVGPLFGEDPSLYNGKVAIPEAFYCIVVDKTESGDFRALALIMNQNVSGKRKLADFVTTIRSIERKTGLDFFSAMPDAIEEKMENSTPEREWQIQILLDANSPALAGAE